MEWLANINTANLIVIVVGIIAILITITLISNKHAIKISKDGLELSKQKEKSIVAETSVKLHEIQRKQLSFVREYLSAVEGDITRYVYSLGYNPYEFNIPYVMELLLDEVITWIIFNNIEDTELFIKSHKDKLWLVYKNAVVAAGRSNTNDKVTFKDQKIDRLSMNWNAQFFEDYTYRISKDIISNLVLIKNSNS